MLAAASSTSAPTATSSNGNRLESRGRAMSDIHNALRKGVLSAALTRAVGDMRGGSGIERYGETLTPIIDLWEQPEFYFLRDEKFCANPRNGSAVAAEFAGSALVNPAGSGLLVVVLHASIDCGAFAGPSSIAQLQQAPEAAVTATFAGGGPGTVIDTRFRNGAATSVSAAQTYVGTDPALPIGLTVELRRNATPTQIDFQNLPIILHPGQAAVMMFGTVNTATNFNWHWRERRAFPSELV